MHSPREVKTHHARAV